MSFTRRSHAVAAFVGASILALAACSDQAPLAPRADASRAQASQSTLSSIGSNRRLIALRDGRPAAAVIARIRALGGSVARSHEGAGLIVATGLTDAAGTLPATRFRTSFMTSDRSLAGRSRTPAGR